MSFAPNLWYTDSAQYTNVSAWQASHAYAAGALVRQLAAPTVGNERVFVCIIAGTSLVSEPLWTVTKGAKTAEAAGPTWMECTGQPTVNGDISVTSSPAWSATTATAQGQTIYDSASASIQIVTTSATTKSGAQPTFSATAGVTTADGTVTWTSLGLASNFTKLAAPHARLFNAVAGGWAVAGNDFPTGDDHNATQSSALTITIPGSSAVPCRVYSYDHTASLPPVAANLNTGAKESTTGASNITIAAVNAYCRGIAFTASDSTNSATLITQNTNGLIVYDSCAFALGGSGSAGKIQVNGSGGSETVFTNTTVSLANAAQTISLLSGTFIWTNTNGSAATLGTAPTILFTIGAVAGKAKLSGIDLSAVGSGSSIVTGTLNGSYDFKAVNCKTNASVTLVTGAIAGPYGATFSFINCGPSATNYTYLKQLYQGTIVHETTVVRSGGASDGTTPVSRKVVTTANDFFFAPMQSDPIVFFCNSTAAQTVSIPIITGGGTPLNNNQIWGEVQELGSSSSPLSSFVNDRASNILSVGSAQPTDSVSSWTTTGITSPVMQILNLSFTPGMKGWYQVTIYISQPSLTMWYDPTVGQLSQRQWQGDGEYINEGASTGKTGGFF